jgi:hypothetical protein
MVEISLIHDYEGGARCDRSPAIAAFLAHNGVGLIFVAAARAGRCYKRDRQRDGDKESMKETATSQPLKPNSIDRESTS